MQEELLGNDIWCYSARRTNKLVVNVIVIIIIIIIIITMKGKTFSVK